MNKINEMIFLLHATAAALRNELDRRLKPLGLSQAKWRLLLILSKSEHPLTQTQIATKIGIECATLVGLLDRLAKMGWVKRIDSPSDRRSKIVFLTPKAQKTLQKIHNTVHKLLREVLTKFDEKELNICVKFLGRLKTQIEEIV